MNGWGKDKSLDNVTPIFSKKDEEHGFQLSVVPGVSGSFEHPKHMLKDMGKKIFTILRFKLLFI